MKKTFKLTSVLMAVVLIVVAFAACSSGEKAADQSKTEVKSTTDASKQPDANKPATPAKKVRVGFSQCQSSDPWRVAQINSIKSEAEKRGYELVYTDAGGDASKQISDVEDIVAQKVDYLILDPREEEGSVPALQAANKAGVKTIVIDRLVKGQAGTDFITYIGTDFVWEGKAAGEWLAKAKNGKANIVEITGTAGSSAAIDRQKGFKEAISKFPDMKIIASQTANFSRADAQKVMENIIQSKGKQFDTVFAHNDEEAMGAIQALKSAGLQPGKDVTVIGIDGEKDAVKAIIAGELSVTVTCNPLYGPITFDTLEKVIKGEKIDTKIILPDYIIDKTNAEEMLPKAF